MPVDHLGRKDDDDVCWQLCKPAVVGQLRRLMACGGRLIRPEATQLKTYMSQAWTDGMSAHLAFAVCCQTERPALLGCVDRHRTLRASSEEASIVHTHRHTQTQTQYRDGLLGVRASEEKREFDTPVSLHPPCLSCPAGPESSPSPHQTQGAGSWLDS